MNFAYLDFLPEVENKYNVELGEGEKVVHASKLHMMGTEKGMLLGMDCDFTLTNKKIRVFNGAGYWTINLLEDIVSGEKVKKGFIFKEEYYLFMLNETMLYDSGKEKLDGYRFYYKDDTKLEDIFANVIK